MATLSGLLPAAATTTTSAAAASFERRQIVAVEVPPPMEMLMTLAPARSHSRSRPPCRVGPWFALAEYPDRNDSWRPELSPARPYLFPVRSDQAGHACAMTIGVGAAVSPGSNKVDSRQKLPARSGCCATPESINRDRDAFAGADLCASWTRRI